MDQDPALKPNVHVIDFLGLASGLLPFVFSYSETVREITRNTPNGLVIETVTTKHSDYVALGGGGLAIAAAVLGLGQLSRMRSRAVRFTVFATLFALGGFQIVRGVLKL